MRGRFSSFLMLSFELSSDFLFALAAKNAGSFLLIKPALYMDSGAPLLIEPVLDMDSGAPRNEIRPLKDYLVLLFSSTECSVWGGGASTTGLS